jgi:hypothetical protein
MAPWMLTDADMSRQKSGVKPLILSALPINPTPTSSSWPLENVSLSGYSRRERLRVSHQRLKTVIFFQLKEQDPDRKSMVLRVKI